MMLKFRLAVILGAMTVCTGGATGAVSSRVDEKDCAAFTAEKAKLAETNISEDLEKGADWGKTNLSAERLKEIERYIFLDEKLTFRCPNVLAAAAVRQMEEQARLKALAALERERLWLERMKKIVPPERKPETKVARTNASSVDGIPPLPERKAR